MAQSTIVDYFNTKKRAAIDESKIHQSRKVVVLDKNEINAIKDRRSKESSPSPCVVYAQNKTKLKEVVVRKKAVTPRSARMKQLQAKAGNIQEMLDKMNKVSKSPLLPETSMKAKEEFEKTQQVTPPNTPTNPANPSVTSPTKKLGVNVSIASPSKHVNAMDKVSSTVRELSYNEIRQKLSRSSRLAELKASMGRFKKGAEKLEEAEKKTAEVRKDSPKLKNFETIELEVNLSPKKLLSPEKPYLSPKKDTTNTVRKNLLSLLSPTKNAVLMPSSPRKELFEAPVKTSLTLPYKYRRLAEIFRAMETATQIMHNRKETVTFNKLKPAVEKMLKQNFTERHLAQIVKLYPDSYLLKQEKLKEFGTGTRNEKWELVLIPQLDQACLSSEVLLERRRKMFSILIEKLKDYHQEFLATLDPPMELARDKITRWHPQFDIEKVPDVELVTIPSLPTESIMTTGREVLDKAREMFSCNTRMERAMDCLKELQEKNTDSAVPPVSEETKLKEATSSLLKGIPKALLEKVRQKQAAKALEAMTRTPAKAKQEQLYSRLPEIARFARNLFVSEKKGVLPIDTVLDKLASSYPTFIMRDQMEIHLRTIEKEAPGWLVFHNIRGCNFVKVDRNADVSLVMDKLERAAEKIRCA